MTSMKGEELLVGWTSDEKDEEKNDEEGQEAMVQEKSPLTTDISSATTESKQIRRWGIKRIPKEDDSDGEYYDEGGNDRNESHDESKGINQPLKARGGENGENNGTNESKDITESNETQVDTRKQQQQVQQSQSRGLWQRLSSLGTRQDEQQNDGNAGLLRNNDSGNDIEGLVGSKSKNDEDSVNEPPDETIDDILVRRLSNKNSSSNTNGESNNSTSKDHERKKLPQDSDNNSKPTSSANGINSDIQKETFEMRNPIEGFGSNSVSQTSQAQENVNANTTTSFNPVTSGISNFFQAMQLRRIKARHEFDPFSLTTEELNILKQDILRRTNDLDAMEQMKIDGSTSRPTENLKNSLKNIQSAVLAPEAFAAYTDRIVDEEDGEDNMGLYRNVPLGGEDDIYDDYNLRQKPMKPMKMEGDEITWSDVVEAVCDPEAYVIDETMYLEDDDPLGVYRGITGKCDDDDDDDVNDDGNGKDVVKEESNAKHAKEIKKLRGEVQSLTDKVQQLLKQLHAKDKENEKWKKKALELEKEIEKLCRK